MGRGINKAVIVGTLGRDPEVRYSAKGNAVVNLSVATTMWNNRSFWKDREPPADHTLRPSPHHLVTLMNAEDERGGGAWMLYGLPGP